MNTTLIFIVLALIAGMIVGALLLQRFSPEIRAKKQLELDLLESETRRTKLQQQIDEHFLTTSDMLSELADKHNQLDRHLATQAYQLVSPELKQQLLLEEHQVEPMVIQAAAQESGPKALDQISDLGSDKEQGKDSAADETTDSGPLSELDNLSITDWVAQQPQQQSQQKAGT